MTQGADIRAMVPCINALQAERDQVAAQLTQGAGSADVVTLHPASIERYAADIARPAYLTALQTEFSESAELTATLRRLMQSVIVHAEPNAQGFSVEIKGSLAELSGASAAFPSRSRGERW